MEENQNLAGLLNRPLTEVEAAAIAAHQAIGLAGRLGRLRATSAAHRLGLALDEAPTTRLRSSQVDAVLRTTLPPPDTRDSNDGVPRGAATLRRAESARDATSRRPGTSAPRVVAPMPTAGAAPPRRQHSGPAWRRLLASIAGDPYAAVTEARFDALVGVAAGARAAAPIVDEAVGAALAHAAQRVVLSGPAVRRVRGDDTPALPRPALEALLSADATRLLVTDCVWLAHARAVPLADAAAADAAVLVADERGGATPPAVVVSWASVRARPASATATPQFVPLTLASETLRHRVACRRRDLQQHVAAGAHGIGADTASSEADWRAFVAALPWVAAEAVCTALPALFPACRADLAHPRWLRECARDVAVAMTGVPFLTPATVDAAMAAHFPLPPAAAEAQPSPRAAASPLSRTQSGLSGSSNGSNTGPGPGPDRNGSGGGGGGGGSSGGRAGHGGTATKAAGAAAADEADEATSWDAAAAALADATFATGSAAAVDGGSGSVVGGGVRVTGPSGHLIHRATSWLSADRRGVRGSGADTARSNASDATSPRGDAASDASAAAGGERRSGASDAGESHPSDAGESHPSIGDATPRGHAVTAKASPRGSSGASVEVGVMAPEGAAAAPAQAAAATPDREGRVAADSSERSGRPSRPGAPASATVAESHGAAHAPPLRASAQPPVASQRDTFAAGAASADGGGESSGGVFLTSLRLGDDGGGSIASSSDSDDAGVGGDDDSGGRAGAHAREDDAAAAAAAASRREAIAALPLAAAALALGRWQTGTPWATALADAQRAAAAGGGGDGSTRSLLSAGPARPGDGSIRSPPPPPAHVRALERATSAAASWPACVLARPSVARRGGDAGSVLRPARVAFAFAAGGGSGARVGSGVGSREPHDNVGSAPRPATASAATRPADAPALPPTDAFTVNVTVGAAATTPGLRVGGADTFKPTPQLSPAPAPAAETTTTTTTRRGARPATDDGSPPLADAPALRARIAAVARAHDAAVKASVAALITERDALLASGRARTAHAAAEVRRQQQRRLLRRASATALSLRVAATAKGAAAAQAALAQLGGDEAEAEAEAGAEGGPWAGSLRASQLVARPRRGHERDPRGTGGVGDDVRGVLLPEAVAAALDAADWTQVRPMAGGGGAGRAADSAARPQWATTTTRRGDAMLPNTVGDGTRPMTAAAAAAGGHDIARRRVSLAGALGLMVTHSFAQSP